MQESQATSNTRLMAAPEVLDELDRFAHRWLDKKRRKTGFDERRSRERRAFRARCKFCFYAAEGHGVLSHFGQTRNLSEGGLGLVTRGIVLPGIPIEVLVAVTDKPPVYFGGIVMHCRYASRGFHEVGIALAAYGDRPVFSDNPGGAAGRLGWISKALQSRSRPGARSTTKTRRTNIKAD